MIIVSIFGGLASQMDQYSFMLALKKAYPDTRFKIDPFFSFELHHNGYELERVFGIKEDKATAMEVAIVSDNIPRGMKHYKLLNILMTLKKCLFGTKDSFITPDDPSAFYPEVFKLNPLKNYLMFGNWANESYRTEIEDEIITAFTFPPIDNKNKEVSDGIVKTNSVSLHVRRGDYLSYGFPLLPKWYYEKAIRIIQEKVDSPHFFIFSDDSEYVRREFSFLDSYTIVDWNKKEDSFRDMQLMSMCKHNIIANSGFSYWGARLNYKSSAIRIAPRYHVPICKHHCGEGSTGWIIIDNKDKNNNELLIL